MPTPNWTRVVIVLSALIATAVILGTGANVDLNEDLARAVGVASTAVIVLLALFDRWLWPWIPFRWLHGHPDLRGTWKVTVRSNYDERSEEEIEGYLVIRQTFSTVSACMLFDRSRSRSMSAALIKDEGRCALYYIFQSDKDALQPASNPPSRGAAELVVGREPRTHLEGHYWMAVGTAGQIRTLGRNKRPYDTFNSARGSSFC